MEALGDWAARELAARVLLKALSDRVRWFPLAEVWAGLLDLDLDLYVEKAGKRLGNYVDETEPDDEWYDEDEGEMKRR